jgi:hypothetical protein
MVAIVFAWRQFSHRRYLGTVAWMLILLAAFTSGAHGAIIMVPLLVLMILILQRNFRTGITAAVAVTVAFLAAASIFGADPLAVFTTARTTGVGEVQAGFVDGMGTAIQIATLGLGTGTIANQSRYAYSNSINPNSGMAGSESWWVKAILELGLLGLLVVLILFGWILVTGYKGHLAIRDPSLRAASAALLAFIAWNLIYLTKGSYLDLDPINVYFWLFAGMLSRIPSLDGFELSSVFPLAQTKAQRTLGQ